MATRRSLDQPGPRKGISEKTGKKWAKAEGRDVISKDVKRIQSRSDGPKQKRKKIVELLKEADEEKLKVILKVVIALLR